MCRETWTLFHQDQFSIAWLAGGGGADDCGNWRLRAGADRTGKRLATLGADGEHSFRLAGGASSLRGGHDGGISQRVARYHDEGAGRGGRTFRVMFGGAWPVPRASTENGVERREKDGRAVNTNWRDGASGLRRKAALSRGAGGKV